MGQPNNSNRRGVTRRAFIGLSGVALLAAFPKSARADLFGGDIGVLLAQLEQQLTMVAKAIETVQAIMASVERLQRVAEQGKTMLQKLSGGQGLKGVLEGVHELANAGRGAIRNLQVLNVRGGQWKDTITSRASAPRRLDEARDELAAARAAGASEGTQLEIKRRISDLERLSDEPTLSLNEGFRMTAEAQELNARFLRDVGNIHESFGQIAMSVKALESMQEATEAADTVDGIVGQTQLLGRQVANLGVIATQHASATTTHASLYTSELEREAMERKTQRSLSESAWKDFDVVEDRGPTDIRWELE